jgi:hypothetical protein
MPNIEIHRLAPIATWLTVVLLAGAGLSACGSSSETASTSVAAPSITPSTSPSKPATTAPATPAKTTTAPGASAKANLERLKRPRNSAPTTTPPKTANAFAKALARFASCLRQNGVKIPASNAAGKGPILSLKGLKTNTPQFRAATTKCRKELITALRRPGQAAAGQAKR